MPTFTIAPSRKPYQRRTAPQAYAQGFYAVELQNIQLGTFPVSGGISIPLTSNLSITLDKSQAQDWDFGFVELVQDHVGGWSPTWTNAVGTNGAPTAPNTAANAPTLYLAVFTRDTWILTLVAENYGNATVNAALAAAFARMTSAMLPLARTQTLVDGYLAAFDE